jgi:YD repeat-containing protein
MHQEQRRNSRWVCEQAGGPAFVNCQAGYMPLVAQADVTDPRGYVREVKFNSTGYVTSDTLALNQPEQQTITYSYYSDNLLQSVTDSLGRVTSFDYDGLGNTTRVTRLDGTPNAVTSTFAYNGPFAQLSSATDPLNHTSTFSY